MTSFKYLGPSPLGLSWGRPDVTTFLDQTALRVHLAIDGTALDPALTVYEQAAVTWAEDYMKRSIMAREHRWVLADFPRGYHRASAHSMRSLQLPRGQTIRVNNIEYTQNGAVRYMYGPSSSGSPPSEDFQEDLHSESGGTIMPLRSRDWPTVDYDAIAPVVVNFRAGWETAEEVPTPIVHAVMFAIDDMLEVRGTADLAQLASIAANGKTALFRESLIGYYRLIRIY